MATNDTLRSITDATTKGDQHLGDIVFWNLSDASIDRATFEARWTAAGLDKALLPELPTAEKTLRVAINSAKTPGATDVLIRQSLRNDVEIVTAVVRETKHENGEPTYDVEATLRLDRALGTLGSTNPLHPQVKTIMEAYTRMRDIHTTDDVRGTIIRTLTSYAACQLRETGGVYWVPTTNAANLRSLQGAIEQFGSSNFYLVPVHNGQDSNRSIGDAAVKSLESELTDLQKEMEGFVSEPPRADTLARRFSTFEALRNRGNLYRTILSVRVTDLDLALDKLADQARELLSNGSGLMDDTK